MKQGELCRTCEKADADAWEDALKAAPDSFKSRVPVRLRRRDHAVLGAVSDLDIVAMNRAVGIGFPEAPSDGELDDIIAFYQDAGSRRFAIQLCPSAETPELVERLQERGFSHFNNWTKLIRRNGGVIPKTDSILRVEKIDAAKGLHFADILCTAFTWPGVTREWISALVGRKGWHHYLAFEGDQPVGTGALFVTDDIGWMGFAATHPDHRRKGAQSLLITERLEQANRLGCSSVVVETAQDMPGRPNSSFHNLLRHGFTVAYQRPNYIRFREDEPHSED